MSTPLERVDSESGSYMPLGRGHLQLLAALSRHGGLGAAANAIQLSASAASHRIREAERRLGVPLIEVVGRSAQLTQAGRLLATAAERAEIQVVQAERTSRWLQGSGRSERLRVGVGAYDTLGWYRRVFAEAEPLGFHSIDLIRVPNGAEERAVADGLVDLALVPRSQPLLTPGVGDPVVGDRLVAVMGSDGGLADRKIIGPRDLDGCHYLAVDVTPLDGWELDRYLMPNQVQPGSLRRVESLSLLVDLVALGQGVSIQPGLAVADAVSSGRLVERPLEIDLAIGWYLIGNAPDGLPLP